MGEHIRTVNIKEENSLMCRHKFKIKEKEIIPTETWAKPLPTKLNKKTINNVWDVPRCYEEVLEEAKIIRATVNQ